jgi:hypothetical protein
VIAVLGICAVAIGHTKVLANPLSKTNSDASPASATKSQTLPMWQYSVTSRVDGNTYNGWMVGRSPFNHGMRTTTIPTYLVPLVVTTPAGRTFDPTAADSSCLGGNDAQSLFLAYPLLNNQNLSFGAAAVGDTQYIDAFQRANFWNANVAITGSAYHTLLGAAAKIATPISVLPVQTITIAQGTGAAYQSSAFSISGCGSFAVVDFNSFDSYLRNTVLPSLVAPYGVNPSALVIFLTYNVVQAYPGISPTNQCCSLGYHSAAIQGQSGSPASPIQTYVTADYDSTNLFGNLDVASISHQIGAWMNDPLGNSFNSVPSWTPPNSQVSARETLLDPGYPLLGVLTQPGSDSIVNSSATAGYDLQELAFYSWFYRQNPSLAVNGWYSTNNTLATDTGAVCGG